ncbi:sugar phosphate isomerase/epimerase family protein [Planctomyces sp. SH-PL62]|uniref:sugar phosphate isomerase/epimerase family protein n=1 Tax=Planctomyces sp. SH-PL62 TaxID=1636152 RepID=UPI00078B18CE|nr:sugar phosphate isomerase/epimerase family protein [Planctomyces sp. SH-PL62]AMV36179.1 L-ribulose-5-phosphate 3-epimerase UlaE [Planctomyces sp. SH-PL62]
MLLGYNTNGLAHHRLTDALRLMAEEGYQSVAITLDAGALDPYEDTAILARQTATVRELLDGLGLGRVVETGARFLLNPRTKHDPTLMDPDPVRRALRVDFLRRAIDLAVALDAGAVSFWSGVLRDGSSEDAALDRLAAALRPVIEHAETQGVRLAFEPEPGMFIDTFDRFARLDERIKHPLFDLTVDVGHVHCNEPRPVADYLREWGPRIANVHIEDMVVGVHEHLMFGEGTMDFPPILAAFREIGYTGGLHVELSRHSPMGAEALRGARTFLAPLLRP